MPLDPAQRHQIEQDAITAAREAERLSACDEAIALLREVADLDRDDDGHKDLMSRIGSPKVRPSRFSQSISQLRSRASLRPSSVFAAVIHGSGPVGAIGSQQGFQGTGGTHAPLAINGAGGMAKFVETALD